jgi:carboxyl-terminal processing protease
LRKSGGSGAAALVCLVALALGGCGGGGGGGASTGGTGGSGGGGGSSLLTYVPGVFPASSNYVNKCQVVRTGVDIEGNAFPDLPGSTLEENFFLRSWTNETYLWNTEVLDQNPALAASTQAYFASLRTFAKTPSGKDKDDFHFSQPTSEYLAQRISAPSASYGAELVVYRSTPPRDVRVLYTEPNTPASAIVNGAPALKRGTRILSVDGVDLVNGASTSAEVAILNNGLFPATAGENHVFVVQDADASTSRTVNITSANLAPKPVNRYSVIDTSVGKVGYVLLNTFSPFATESDLREALSFLSVSGVNELVLDLRYNGGGLLAVASQLSYMVAGPAQTTGKNFERLQFNAAAGNRNPVTGEINTPTPFYTTGLGFSVPFGTTLPTLNLSRVFVLSTEDTCSASEAVVNGLRGIDVDVVLIGGRTCGKPFGFYPTSNCGTTYYSIQFQGVNHKNFGDYADGFVPEDFTAGEPGVRITGCTVPDSLSKELGDPAEDLLETAISYAETGSCPTLLTKDAAIAAGPAAGTGRAIATTNLSPAEQILQNNRDMRMPR